MHNTSHDHEPTEDAIKAWLASHEGSAALKQLLQDATDGKHGELHPELLTQVNETLKRHEAVEKACLIQHRIGTLRDRLGEPPEEWPENSRWARVQALHNECKAILDLVLELPEPHRTMLMNKFLPFQQMIEKLENETE